MAAGPVRPRARVRLTRRGRLVLLVLLLLPVAAAAVLAGGASRAADPAPPARSAVVQPEDTLWSVARRHAPGADPFATIELIRQLNALPDYTVHPGQTLRLPGAR